MSWLNALKSRARHLRSETLALWFAARHPSTPWYAKAWLLFVVAYALSPVDLIPDFIPVLGYIDELILLPIALSIALRLVPPEVMNECRKRAGKWVADTRRMGLIAAGAVIAIWITVAGIALTVF